MCSHANQNTKQFTSPFTESLPDFHAVCCRLLFLQEQMELVHVVAGRLMLGAVDGHTVPDLILHNEHPKLLELLSELLDVIADEAIRKLS